MNGRKAKALRRQRERQGYDPKQDRQPASRRIVPCADCTHPMTVPVAPDGSIDPKHYCSDNCRWNAKAKQMMAEANATPC